MTVFVELKIDQLANNPHHEFLIQILVDGVCVLFQYCDSYSMQEYVQHPQFKGVK